jgi:hypothetical protein
MTTFSRRYDMNRSSQVKEGKSWILPKEINANRILLRLSLAGNLEKNHPLMSLYGTELRERVYGLCICPYIKGKPRIGR